jgi:hypothetical protein
MKPEPFRYHQGEPLPLFVPPAALADFRKRFPDLWIEPAHPLPLGTGRLYTMEDKA